VALRVGSRPERDAVTPAAVSSDLATTAKDRSLQEALSRVGPPPGRAGEDARPAAPARIVREAVEALAIHHEHRVRDFTQASAFARRALNLDMTLTLNGEVDSRRRAAARHRLARLDRKQ